MKFIVHTDGGARGNPGPAAIGVVIHELKAGTSDKLLLEFGKTIGVATNNVAEYQAVIEALGALQEHFFGNVEQVKFILDSVLVVNQLNGKFRIKEPHLKILSSTIKRLEQNVGGVITYEAVRREFNKRADYFVNVALDNAV